MIRNEVEYQGAEREMQYLKDFLSPESCKFSEEYNLYEPQSGGVGIRRRLSGLS